MILSMIACIDELNGLGYQGDLLFKQHEDMQWFKRQTTNKPVLMGRLTYESIGMPLPKRINIVLTSDTSYSPHPNILVRHSLSEVLHEFRNERELVVIGGSQLYSTLLPIADRMYLTKVHHAFNQVDTHFPVFNPNEWREYFHKEGSEASKYNYSFHAYKRKEE